MADFSGLSTSWYDTCDEYAHAAPAPARSTAVAVWMTGEFAGTRASGGATPIPAGTGNVTGKAWPEATPRKDWFDHVHMLPRGLINFGNIVTRVTEQFEIFNAHGVPVDLTIIDTSAGAGVDVFNPPSLPVTIPAYVSLLDPSSTRFNAVLYEVEALTEGAPVFDGNLEFTFSTSEVLDLPVKGVRIVFFQAEPEAPFSERVTFFTQVMRSVSGSERRVAGRQNMQQHFDYTILCDEYDRRALQSQLYGWLGKTFAIPLWQERILLTAPVGAGATTLSCGSTADVDFRAGGLAVIYESPTKYDVLVLDAVGASSLTFTNSPLLNTYASTGIKIMPLRTACMSHMPSGSKWARNLEKFVVSFQCLDNSTGAPSGTTSGWDTYGGYPLLDDANVLDSDEQSESWEQKVVVIDNQTGSAAPQTRWDFSRHGTTKGFRCRTRAEILKLRRLLVAVAGQQKAFYLPTFSEDLTPAAAVLASDVTLDVENVGFTRFCQSRANRNVVRVTFTDGTSLTRGVTSSVEVSDTVEQLSLSAGFPANRAIAEFSRVEFFELVRFATDEFNIKHEQVGFAKLLAPVVSVT